jgi:hypothetical protein
MNKFIVVSIIFGLFLICRNMLATENLKQKQLRAKEAQCPLSMKQEYIKSLANHFMSLRQYDSATFYAEMLMTEISSEDSAYVLGKPLAILSNCLSECIL